MLSELSTENNVSQQIQASAAAAGSIYKSVDSESEEDEKIQNSQKLKLDSIEISSQARAAMGLGSVVAAAQSAAENKAEEPVAKDATPAANRNTESASAFAANSVI